LWGGLGEATPCIFLPMVAVVSFLALLLTANPATTQGSRTFDQIAREADAARTSDQGQRAIDLYQEGLKLRPSWSEGWWDLGSLFYDQDRFPEAEAAFRHFDAITRKPGPAFAFLGLCEYETQDYEQSLRHFRSWAASGWAGTPELTDVALFHFALLLTRDGRFIEALYLLTTEVQRRGRSPALAEAMGLASLRMKSLPHEYPAQQREMVWLAGNSALYAALPPNDFARADEFANRLIAHYDQTENVHYYVGTLRGFEGKKEDAEKEFRRELEISPQNVAAMLELARIDLEADHLPEAEEFAKRSVDLEPRNPETHHVLGRVLLASNQTENSVRELEAAKRLAPDGATIRGHLAMAYFRVGRKAEAQAEMAAFSELKAKEGVFAPPAEKIKAVKQAGRE
jgi:tetratricopeptide (TPR) repeat protein